MEPQVALVLAACEGVSWYCRDFVLGSLYSSGFCTVPSEALWNCCGYQYFFAQEVGVGLSSWCYFAKESFFVKCFGLFTMLTLMVWTLNKPNYINVLISQIVGQGNILTDLLVGFSLKAGRFCWWSYASNFVILLGIS